MQKINKKTCKKAWKIQNTWWLQKPSIWAAEIAQLLAITHRIADFLVEPAKRTVNYCRVNLQKLNTKGTFLGVLSRWYLPVWPWEPNWWAWNLAEQLSKTCNWKFLSSFSNVCCEFWCLFHCFCNVPFKWFSISINFIRKACVIN